MSPFRVAALTGAGVSAESGIQTFRGAGGLWNGVPIEEVATPQGWVRSPLKVWEFYQARRVQAATCQPNPAHRALARIEHALDDRFTLITQNVDGLHALAGNQRVLELHGSLWRVRCLKCQGELEDRTVPFPELPPRCACQGVLRPAIVWFGETLPPGIFEKAYEVARESDLFLVVGTSGVVEPAASLARVAASAGAEVWEVNPEASALAPICSRSFRAPAGEVMDAVVDEVLKKSEEVRR
jgi:NAD-dependent deacetylase